MHAPGPPPQAHERYPEGPGLLSDRNVFPCFSSLPIAFSSWELLSPFVHITRKVSTKLYVAEPGRVLADSSYLFATALTYGSLPILFGVSCSHCAAIAAPSIFYVDVFVLPAPLPTPSSPPTPRYPPL